MHLSQIVIWDFNINGPQERCMYFSNIIMAIVAGNSILFWGKLSIEVYLIPTFSFSFGSNVNIHLCRLKNNKWILESWYD